MNTIALSSLAGLGVAGTEAPLPREVDPSSAQQFRQLMAAPSNDGGFDLDIEKLMASSLPSPQATPAEFAVGLLRAQVKVSQAALSIELVSKTTQSLSQGVQSLTARG